MILPFKNIPTPNSKDMSAKGQKQRNIALANELELSYTRIIRDRVILKRPIR